MCRAAPPTANPADFTHKIVRDLHWVLTSPHLLAQNAIVPTLPDEQAAPFRKMVAHPVVQQRLNWMGGQDCVAVTERCLRQWRVGVGIDYTTALAVGCTWATSIHPMVGALPRQSR